MKNDLIIKELKDYIENKYGIATRAGIIIFTDKNNEIQLSSMFSLNISFLIEIIDKYKELRNVYRK